MHKSDLIARVSELSELSNDQSNTLVNAIFEEITNALSREETVSLIGFGTFSQRARAARSGRNPSTGEPIEIAASTSVGFKPGKALKDAVNQ